MNHPSRTHTLSTLCALCLLSFLCAFVSCTGCKDDGSAAGDSVASTIFDHITEEKLAQHKPTKHFEQHGHSKAFKIHPLKEMRISAKKGAFETDPDVQVMRCDETLMELLDNVTKENLKDSHLLFAWDIDCGLGRDSVAPGVFNVEINLKKLGVPENLWSALRFYRTDGVELFEEVNTRVDKKGIVHYTARQNTFFECVVVGLALLPVAGVGVTIYPGVGLDVGALWDAAGYPSNWWKASDCIKLIVGDSHGCFQLVFRASQTELGDGASKLVKTYQQFSKEISDVYDEAQEIYREKHKKGKEPVPTFKTSGLDCSTYRMEVDSIRSELLQKNDSLLKELEKQLPQSVKDVMNGTRLAMRFCQASDGLGLKPMTKLFNVYIIPSTYPRMSTSRAISQEIPGIGRFIAINKDKLVKDGQYVKGATDPVLVSMTHELSHLYEYTYLNYSLVRRNDFIEALGAYSEHKFTAWLKKHGYIQYDPETPPYNDISNKEKCLYANQTFKEALCWPLGITYPGKVLDVDISDDGYMLSQLVQYLCEHVPGGNKVTFDHMMNNYSYEKTFLQDMKDIFGIKSDRDFMKYYEGFCKEKMFEIVEHQKAYQGNVMASDKTDVRLRYKHIKGDAFKYLPNSRFHTPSACVMRIGGDYHYDFEHNGSGRAYPFCVKSVSIYNDEPRWNNNELKKNPGLKADINCTPYNLFAVPSPQVKNSHMFFTLLESRDKNYCYTEDPCFMKASAKKNLTEGHCVFITRPDITNVEFGPDYYIDIVAFYRPYNLPKVKGSSKDGTGLNIDTKDKPFDDLKEHRYVSGMQLAVINHQTGKSKTFNIPLSKCGKTVKIDYAKIGVKDKDDIDVSVRTRWFFNHPNGKRYFSPATDRVHYQKKQKQEQQKKEEVKPEEEEIKTRNDEEVDEDKGYVDKYVD
jgi:hypothetical protein